MFTLETRNKPRGRFVREQDSANKTVRVYRNSPDDLILQLWKGRTYMLVALSPAEARAIGASLIATANEVDPMPPTEKADALLRTAARI